MELNGDGGVTATTWGRTAGVVTYAALGALLAARASWSLAKTAAATATTRGRMAGALTYAALGALPVARPGSA